MTKKIVFGAMLVTLVASVTAPSVSANCIPAKSAATFGAGTTAYWMPAASGGTGSAQAWQLGAPGTFSMSAACVAGQTGIFTDVGGGLSLNLNLGDACAAGCPSGPIATLAYYQTPAATTFLLDTVAETGAAAVNFDYGAQGSHNMIPIPRPRVVSSSRVATNVNLSVALDSISAGLFGPNASSAVTGFRILTKSSATDPGRDAASYDAVPAAVVVSPGGGAATQPVVLNCTNPQDQWIAVQLSFEGGTVLSGAVGGATRVRCDPALANPKNVPTKKVAPMGRVN